MKKSRYVISTDSYDGESNIFYNIRNNVGIKIPKQFAGNFQDATNVSKIRTFFDKYQFFNNETEAEDVLQNYINHRNNSLPFHLVILPHENCNFRCVYCYEKFEKNKMHNEIEEGIVNLVKRNLLNRKNNKFSVSWFGGEPLLAPDIIERLSKVFISEAEKNNVPYAATITTNGYFLNDKNIDMLLKSRVYGYQITIDGTEHVHDKQRVLMGGQGTYKKIIKNLINLSKREEDFHVMLRMNVGEDNLHNVEEYIDEMKEHFGNDKRFKLYFQNIGKWGGENDENLDVCPENIAVKLTNLSLDKQMEVEPIEKKIRNNNVCYASNPNSYVIGTDGIVYKCTVALYDERNKVGKLNKDGSMHLDKEKFKLWTNSGVEDSNCKQCFFAPSCHGDSCPWIRINENRSPCPDFKSQINEIVTTIDRQDNRLVSIT